MAAHATAIVVPRPSVVLNHSGSFPRIRVLAWQDDLLYGSQGYCLMRSCPANPIRWQPVAQWRPALWRNTTCRSRLTARLFRDGFHALAILSSGDLIGAVPGAIVRLAPGESQFTESFRGFRGTRPLHFAVTPDNHIFFGEYFDNPRREAVRIYVSADRGAHWEIAYTFPAGKIRHVHNIVYDQWEKCLWILTGDDDSECQIVRASCDFSAIDLVHSGNQHTRVAALIPTADSLFFASDTPFARNHIYRLDRRGNLTELAEISGSCINGCRVRNAIFFSTMVEPSNVNRERDVCLYGSSDGWQWERLLQWRKDRWPMRWLQHGNAFVPDGNNTSDFLALSTVAVVGADCETNLWHIDHPLPGI